VRRSERGLRAGEALTETRRGLRAWSPYDQNVFVNCPFDAAYRPLLNAIVFAVQDCGLFARCAMEVQDSGEVRITKIKRIIRQCRHGIHDISRVDLDAATGLPRFNMPLELGMFLGAQEYGTRDQRRKRCLILDEQPYRYQVFCSDLAGHDIVAHGADVDRTITAVRDWLGSWLCEEGEIVPSDDTMHSRYLAFCKDLAELCQMLRLKPERLLFLEFRTFVEEWTDEYADERAKWW
jgi:hypothetical protein